MQENYTQPLKLYIGGSPCTHWSIAQKNNRETEPGGLGWELFKNFLIARDKFKPDYFLYENNKSMAKPIRNQIDIEFNSTYAENTNWELISSAEEDKGHTKRWLWRNKTTDKTEYITRILINSALVSAQNRQRYYWTNIPNVQQPADRGILLKDILESGTDLSQNEKGYALTTRCQGAIPEDTIQKHRHSMVAEPVMFQEPIKVGYVGNGGQGNRIYSVDGKAVSQTATSGGMGSNTGLYACPINTTKNGKAQCIRASYYKDGIRNMVGNDVDRRTCVAEPIRIGDIGSNSQAHRVYSAEGKSVTINANGGGQGGKTGLYAVPVDDLTPFVQKKIKPIVNKYGYLPEKFNPYNAAEITDKAPTLTAQCGSQTKSSTVMVVESWDGKTYPIYEVKDGLIEIKGKTYPIRLQDGYYIIRKLTVLECKRLQTVRDNYIFPVSNSQAYKMLGNGWTFEVIKHILSHIPNIANCDVEVLSVYDGMSCGNLALEGLGGNVIRYDAYEIDKYAIQTTQANFPQTEQRGDAFQVRQENWKY